jgi:2-dehydro-3-deoxygluconokinase
MTPVPIHLCQHSPSSFERETSMSSSVLCFGELLLRLGAPGQQLLLQTPSLDVHAGGAEANVGVALACLGHDVAMAGVVADNALGSAVLGELRRHGVDTRHVRRSAGRMGLYFMTAGAGLRPGEVVYDRAESAFATAPADSYDWPTLLQGAQWLHLSGISPALGPQAAQATLAAARAACDMGIKVSFDGNFRPRLWERWGGDAQAILRDLFACAHIVFADHRDIGVVLGGEFSQGDAQARVDAAAAMAFAAFPQLQYMACTQRTTHNASRHALGAMLLGRDGTRALAPVRELDGIVDRIGGGDAFAAGVLHGLMEGFDSATTIRFGLAAGCLKHSIPGDFCPVGVADVMALMDEETFDVRR